MHNLFALLDNEQDGREVGVQDKVIELGEFDDHIRHDFKQTIISFSPHVYQPSQNDTILTVVVEDCQ